MQLERRITVFGASGFIGTQVVRRLAPRGWVVRAAVRDPAAAAHLKPLGQVGQIVPMRADLTDEGECAVAVDGADAVINLVGILHVRGTQGFEEVQAEGPEALARIAHAAGSSVYHVRAAVLAAQAP